MLQTYQPNKKKAKKDHGFFARKQAGTSVVNNRRKKGRKRLTK
jgi:ribosomal protein L34